MIWSDFSNRILLEPSLVPRKLLCCSVMILCLLFFLFKEYWERFILYKTAVILERKCVHWKLSCVAGLGWNSLCCWHSGFGEMSLEGLTGISGPDSRSTLIPF